MRMIGIQLLGYRNQPGGRHPQLFYYVQYVQYHSYVVFSATEGIKIINSYHRFNNSNNDDIAEYPADPYNNWLTLPKL